MRIESDRNRVFAVRPEELWGLLASVDLYPTWWPWLHQFEASGLATSSTWRCVVRAPLGYPVRFELTLDRVEAPSLVEARLAGDIMGDASVRVEPHADGSALAFWSSLEPSAGHLRLLGRLAPWLARRGHDEVVDAALRQFAERAIG